MGVDGSVTSRARQVLVLTVRDVEVSLGVTVLLGQTEVDDVDLVAALANTHQEVVGLDVTMDEVTRVDVFHAGNLRQNDKRAFTRNVGLVSISPIGQRATGRSLD